MKKYDVIVIGSGVGLAFANQAVNKGLKTAIIEKSKFGGTCLTKGCIPSKILIQPANIINEVKRSKKVGIKTKGISLDWKTLSKRMWNKIGFSHIMEEAHKKIENLDVYNGVANFIDDYTLNVKMDSGDTIIQADKIIITCGTRSNVPNIKGLKETEYITYESFYGDKFPKKLWKDLIIIGGGIIGCEFANIFSSYGVNVKIVELADRLLIKEDEEVSDLLKKSFETRGLEVYTNSSVLEVKKTKKQKVVVVKHDNETIELNADEIIMATGIRPNTDLLTLKNTSIKLDDHGYVKTNDLFETNVSGIYAFGDCNGKYQFRHKANFEMYHAVKTILEDNPTPIKYDAIPWAVFTDPQIAHLGLTQKEALEEYDKILVGKLKYSQVAKGYAMGFDDGDLDDGFVKLILNPKMQIIGAHIIGPHADILIQSYIYLMSTKCICNLQGFEDYINTETKGYLFNPMQDAMTIHPSLSELTGWTYRMLKWVEK